MMTRKEKRKRNHNKKQYKKFAILELSKLVPGSYVIDCRNHPCVVLESYYTDGKLWPEDILVKSLLNGIRSSCSTRHCGTEPISQPRAEELVALFKQGGFNAVLKATGHTDEDIAYFEELDKVWNFDKGEVNERR